VLKYAHALSNYTKVAFIFQLTSKKKKKNKKKLFDIYMHFHDQVASAGSVRATK
jgi:hypothetical protein